MWQNGSEILFTCKVQETGQECLSGGWVELRAGAGDERAQNSAGNSNLKSAAVFAELARRLEAQPEMSAKVGAVFKWVITDEQGKPADEWGT